VQTVVGNFIDRERVRGSVMHVDWSGMPKPFVYNGVETLPAPVAAECALIRKVSSADPGLLRHLSRRCLEPGT